jgi:small-conductance mechanosensitive channel
MNFRRFAPIASLSALCLLGLLLPARALAQDTPVDPTTLRQLANVVRWSGVVTSLFVIMGAWLSLRFLREFVERMSLQFARFRLQLQKTETILQFLIYVSVAILSIMLSFRLDDRVLALIGGTLAVSVGFAMKDLVASMMAGVVIMADRPFQVGDRVSFAGEYGDVTAVGLRSVRIQTLDDNTVTVPNSKFLTEVVSSGNFGQLDMMVVLDFYVGLDQDVDAARRIVHDAAISSRFVYLRKPAVVDVLQVMHDNYLTVRLRLKAYVLDTRHEIAFGTDVTLRVLQAFRELEIEAPRMLLSGGASARSSTRGA